MESGAHAAVAQQVALLAEGVDRNVMSTVAFGLTTPVALLAEGVDRNSLWCVVLTSRRRVALLAEGVDRNRNNRQDRLGNLGRPPRGGRG